MHFLLDRLILLYINFVAEWLFLFKFEVTYIKFLTFNLNFAFQLNPVKVTSSGYLPNHSRMQKFFKYRKLLNYLLSIPIHLTEFLLTLKLNLIGDYWYLFDCQISLLFQFILSFCVVLLFYLPIMIQFWAIHLVFYLTILGLIYYISFPLQYYQGFGSQNFPVYVKEYHRKFILPIFKK
jgi:hypothetical protein